MLAPAGKQHRLGMAQKQYVSRGLKEMLEEQYGKPCLNGIERRCGTDRREYSLVTLMRSLFGRRALGRRASDQIGSYVDLFGPRMLLLTLSIITLCSADAIFTLNLIHTGIAEEFNPLMRWTIEQCVYFFITLKLGLTVFGLLVLMGLKNFYVFNRIKVAHILYATLFCYALLIKYEVWLHTI